MSKRSGRWGRVSGVLAIALLLGACAGRFADALSTSRALLVGLLAVCLVVVSIGSSAKRLLREREPAQAAATAYLDALVTEDVATAYELLSDTRRRETSLAEFTASSDGDARITGFALSGTTVIGGSRPPRAEVHGQARFASGEAATLLVRLSRSDDGRWRVEDALTGPRL